MTNLNRIALLLCIISCSLFIHSTATAQKIKGTKKLKVSGDYVHPPTKTVLPETIAGLRREDVTTFDKKQNGVGASYELEDDRGKIRLSIYIYPVGQVTDVSFRDEYNTCLYVLADNKQTEFQQQYTYYKKDGYTLHGFRASFDGKKKEIHELYQCGQWFLKLRVTTNWIDTAAIANLNKTVVQAIAPEGMVRSSSFSTKSKMVISREALNDELLLGCTVGSALAKVKWAQDNVDSMEKLSGFPELHLDLYMEGLKSFVAFADTQKTMKVYPFMEKQLRDLRSLIASGYLDEFIMEKYSLVMIVPADKTFNSIEYYKWKETHPIDFSFDKRYYYIEYPPLK